MTADYLHICYQPNQFWGARIAGRARQSCSTTLRQRMAAWPTSPLREMCLALATKFAMLLQVIGRIDHQLERLGKEMSDPAKIDECLQQGACYPIADKDLPFEVLVDVDSFLFESRSA